MGRARNKNLVEMKTETIGKKCEQKGSWITHPTKKILLIFLATWFVGTGLLVLAATDLFRESFLNRKYIMIYVLITMSTRTTFKLLLNYFKSKSTIEQNS